MYRLILFIAGLMGIVLSPVSLEQARLYRADTVLSFDDDQLRKQKLVEEFCTELKIYTDIDLSPIIATFIYDATGIKCPPHHIVDAASTFLTGKSSDKVFLIYHDSDKLEYVVKVFNNPRSLTGKFLPEISALDLLMSLNLPHVEPVQPLAASLCLCNDKEYGLLLESAARGTRLDQYIYKIAQFPENSFERESMLNETEKAFKRMGESLAYLHATQSKELHSLPSVILEKMDQKIQEVLSHPFISKSLSQYMLAETFTGYLAFLKKQVEDLQIYLTYQHGDFHLGNVFYDDSKDVFSFIDTAVLHKSVDINKNPLLDGTSDILRADEHFRRKAFAFLSQDEIERLISVYYCSYVDIAGSLPDARLMTFYRAYLKLGRLLKYCDYQNETDPQKKARDEAIFTQVLDYFAEECAHLEQKRFIPHLVQCQEYRD